VKFGLHTGPQLCTIDELRQLWHFADENRFHWVSIWDHFYPAQFQGHDGPCLDAVAAHTALACETKHVRVGCLVYCVGYRHPAVLAKALATIDHVSGGRMECGLGTGWHEPEFAAHGIPFLPIGQRLDQLEEAARIIRGLWTEKQTTVEGKHFTVKGAYGEPKPLQARARIWIGGGGEKRLLRLVARHADGWNIPFVGPEAYAHKNGVLNAWCERERRDPDEIVRTVNLGLAMVEREGDVGGLETRLRAQFGGMYDVLSAGMLIGTAERISERIQAYRRAGAQWIILALRAPFDVASLRLFSQRVMPAFA
jgi:alkanesulfonate monooxygenase SsuD/methylene tetrahydromethanopterin reductase-like flavin-dependent oxidoreductase (luciferase family)